MKIGIAGAGAVGAYFGGLLAKAGHDVIFLARGAHLEAMEKEGLHVIKGKEKFTVEQTFTNNPKDIAAVDLVLFTVKSHDTKDIAEQLQPYVQAHTIVLTMQNGVDNEEKLVDVFGEKRVLSAATYIQAEITKPGTVEQQGDVTVVFGHLIDEMKEKRDEVADLFKQAKVEIRLASNILRNKWNKLLWNVTFNPLSALMEVRVGEILEKESLRSVAEQICREAIRVAKQRGMELEEETVVERVFANAYHARDHQTSMLQDRIQGKTMEIDSVCGYIVEKGKVEGVSVDTLETVYRLLQYINEQM